jgi:bla regulator protein BlaR1
MTLPELWTPGWTYALFNHLWQSTVVVLLAWLLTLALKNKQARVRYAVWMAASIKFLIPFVLFVDLGTNLGKPIAARHIGSALYTAVDAASQPFQQASTSVVATAVSAHAANKTALPSLCLALIWMCGCAVVTAISIAQWWRALRIVQDAMPVSSGREFEALRRTADTAGMKRSISMRMSPCAIEPGVLGVIHPVLLWPAGISDQLSDAQLAAIAAHELEHVRRNDNLTALLHTLVETLFWFHPAMRWMGSRLVEERERACDERVLEQSAKPEAYAESILKVCAFCLEPRIPCLAGVSSSDLKTRISRILVHRKHANLSRAGKFALSVLGILAVGGPVAFGVLDAMQDSAQLVHASTAPLPSFEVATIKTNNEKESDVHILLSPAGLVTKHTSLKELIRFAYGMKSDAQLIGAPNWVNSEFFDIQTRKSDADTKATDTLSKEQRRNQIRLMVQSLLASRFGLKATIETRDLPVYALVVAKGGTKMKEVHLDPMPRGGTLTPPGAHLARLMLSRPNHFTATAWPMEEMTDWLSRFEELSNRVVVNETGLKGNYDFILDGVAVEPSLPPDPNGGTKAPATSIFTALQEQLGLELESRKAPVEVLIIDHVEHPSAN